MLNTGWTNKSSSRRNPCACGSWKYHWIRFSHRSWPAKCRIKGCKNYATIGGIIYNSELDEEKIVPVCEECSKSNEVLYLKDHTVLVSADKKQTCEKKIKV